MYYSPLVYKDKKTGNIIDIHKIYEAFQVKDELSYFHIIFGGMILFPMVIL